MPYYVFKIAAGPTELFKNLELVDEFDSYKDAKNLARQTREALDSTGDNAGDSADSITVKVMFADNRLQAEEQLMESRDKPVLREWEK